MVGRVFVAGATGAVGVPLCRILVAAGWTVFGTTRRPEKAGALRENGVEPVVLDVFDEAALTAAVEAARPDAVIHQLTDLPAGLDPARMAEARPRNARLRDIGTRNLILASLRAGARRLVAQSIAFAYRPGIVRPDETAPLDPEQQGVISLERQVLEAPLDGVVLRYGRFYGPGTGFDSNDRPASVHVDAAAEAALLALTRGHGIYNIAEDDGEVAIDRARAELGWSPDFRIG